MIITKVTARAFDRDQVFYFEDENILMRYNYIRRVRIICHTARVKEIINYKAVIVNKLMTQE